MLLSASRVAGSVTAALPAATVPDVTSGPAVDSLPILLAAAGLGVVGMAALVGAGTLVLRSKRRDAG